MRRKQWLYLSEWGQSSQGSYISAGPEESIANHLEGTWSEMRGKTTSKIPGHDCSYWNGHMRKNQKSRMGQILETLCHTEILNFVL